MKFFKLEYKYARPGYKTAAVVAVVLLTAGLVLSFYLKGDGTSSDAHYYHQRLKTVQSANSLVSSTVKQQHNDDLKSGIEDTKTYEAELLNGIAACRQTDGYYEKRKDEVDDKPLLDAMGEVKQFCADYVTIADYARQVSGSTRQFVSFPSQLLAADSAVDSNGGQAKKALSDLLEVLGYAKTDLQKLTSDPTNDPALPELVATIENLQKQVSVAQNNVAPSSSEASSLNALSLEVAKQQTNLLNARRYFWNTTVQLDGLERSVDLLLSRFEE